MCRKILAIGACTGLLFLLACSENTAPTKATASETGAATATKSATKSAETPKADAAPSQQELIERGRSVYMSNCIACHNPDPTQDGAIGPANAGSSEALLEDKVIHNTYPPGYKPKRDSNAMMALPHLQKDIPALHAYLNSFGS